MNEPTLFDPDRTTPTRCPVCGCTRQPDQDRAQECGVDLSRKAGDYLTRPTECLNMPDPANTPIPY